jgi:hypothetical protein
MYFLPRFIDYFSILSSSSLKYNYYALNINKMAIKAKERTGMTIIDIIRISYKKAWRSLAVLSYLRLARQKFQKTPTKKTLIIDKSNP